MGIPANVLAQMHRWVGETFDKTGEIQTAVKVPTDEGGETEVWQPTIAGVPFSVSEGFGGQQVLEQPILERIGTRVPFFLAFEHDISLDEAQRIKQTAPLPVRTFEVVGVPNKGASNQMATRVVAVEID